MADDNVISIVGLLGQRKVDSGLVKEVDGVDYPIFEGKILAIGGQIFENDVTSSVIDYIPNGVEVPKPEFGDIFFKHNMEEYRSALESKHQRVVVPFQVHPEMLNGSEVKAYFDELPSDGQNVSVYVLEITKGRIKSGGDVFAMMGEIAGGREHTGFKYIKVL